MNAITTEHLEKMQCSDPECNHSDCESLYMHAPCHIEAPPWLRYSKSLGTLILECSVCHRDVAMFRTGSIFAIHLHPHQVKLVDEALEHTTNLWQLDAKQSGDPRCLQVAEEYVKVRKAIRAQIEPGNA